MAIMMIERMFWEKFVLHIAHPFILPLNESPYYMCFGRDVNFPTNKILGAVPDQVASSNYVETLLERLRSSFQRANEYNVKARLNNKKQYDKRAIIFNCKRGDRILLDIGLVKREITENLLSN
jgi:hypothetical protein